MLCTVQTRFSVLQLPQLKCSWLFWLNSAKCSHQTRSHILTISEISSLEAILLTGVCMCECVCACVRACVCVHILARVYFDYVLVLCFDYVLQSREIPHEKIHYYCNVCTWSLVCVMYFQSTHFFFFFVLPGEIQRSGVLLPTTPDIYQPVLKALAHMGISAKVTTCAVWGTRHLPTSVDSLGIFCQCRFTGSLLPVLIH